MTLEAWFGVLGVAAGALSVAISFVAGRSAQRGRAASLSDFALEAQEIIAEHQKSLAARRAPVKAAATRRRSGRG